MTLTTKFIQEYREYFFGNLFPEIPEPDKWLEDNFIFDEEEISGPWSFKGRNYLRQIVNDNNRVEVRRQTPVTGTGAGKTIAYIGGIAWCFKFKPFRGLYIMPTSKEEGGAGTFADSRLIPDMKATECLREIFPMDGQERFKVNKKFINLNRSRIGFVGSNSPSQVASNRCSKIWMDETDKFKAKLGNEAGTNVLVRNRTKGVVDFQIFETSTPTVSNGIIWLSLMRSCLHLYFYPCPLCNPKVNSCAKNFKGWFALAWNEDFSIGLPVKIGDTRIPYGFVKWDEKARLKNGGWNYQTVEETAHIECPHCRGEIWDIERGKDGKIRIFTETKEWMDECGQWILVKPGVPGHVGYHLSSLYAPVINKESTWGGYAVNFLSAQESGGEDMRDFINSTLALPEVGQGEGLSRIEMQGKPLAQADWVAMLTADFHKNYPYIWFVVRKWCAFKLLPEFKMENGKPEFYELLKQPGNEGALKRAETLTDGKDEVWPVLAELMRFDSRTGVSPLVDWLLTKKIVGRKLLKLYEQAGNKTIEFRSLILKEMELPVSRGGDSELVACGHLSLSGDYVWDELKDIIHEFEIGKGMGIPGRYVGIDTGYAERFNREVLRKCFESGTMFKYYDPMSRNRPPLFYDKAIHQHCQPCPMDGWLGMKGYPLNQRWNYNGVRNELNMSIDDPFFGTPEAGRAVTEVLEFPMALFWLRKDDIRKRRTKLAYAISPEINFFPRIKNVDDSFKMENGRPDSTFTLQDYERQLNEQYWGKKKGQVVPRHGRGGTQSRMYPYHLDDCENMQLALATYHEFFENEEKK